MTIHPAKLIDDAVAAGGNIRKESASIGGEMNYSGIFAIVVGIGMIGQWSVSLIRKGVPELETEPYRIWFHLAGEFSTATLLIAAGIGLLTGQTWSTNTYLIALGMLVYTVIVSPGYFAQKGQWVMVAGFGLILILGMTSLIILL